jgi:membrane fusion protein (multidrug efflux system)
MQGGFLRARAAVGALLLLVAPACRGHAAAPATEKTAPAQPPIVEVVTVVEQPLNVTLSLPGELTPYQTVALYSRVTGFVKSITVDRGTRVSAGQQLATLEAPELVAQRSEAQSKLQSAEAQLAALRAKADASASTYERLKAASATPGVVAGNDVVLAQKAVEADQNQISAAMENVEAARQALASVRDMEGYLRITAPFAGVVTERNVHPGALVGPTGGGGTALPIVRIVESNRLRLVIPVPEAYTAGISNGSSLTFTVAAYPGQTFTGTVSRISQAVDVATRTMAVELDVNNADGRLAPGTFAQVKWPVRRTAPSLLVPAGSVASTTGRTFVIRVRDGRTEWVDVKTGLTSGPLVEVFGELKAGDEIAARGTDELKAGASVQVRQAKRSATFSPSP